MNHQKELSEKVWEKYIVKDEEEIKDKKDKKEEENGITREMLVNFLYG